MGVTIEDGVVVVKHVGQGKTEEAPILCEPLKKAILDLQKQGKPIAVFHDISELLAAEEGYAMAFAYLFKDLKPLQPVQVALIHKPVLRVLARIASTIASADLKIFSRREDCIEYLQSRGFMQATLAE